MFLGLLGGGAGAAAGIAAAAIAASGATVKSFFEAILVVLIAVKNKWKKVNSYESYSDKNNYMGKIFLERMWTRACIIAHLQVFHHHCERAHKSCLFIFRQAFKCSVIH